VIVVVDYGMGNLASVLNAASRYASDVCISSDPEKISSADKVILPGVGSFADAYCQIERRGLIQPILNSIHSGKHFLGICLGLQLLFTRSHENGLHKGFDIIKGDVVPFRPVMGLKIPHMGWNQVTYNLQLTTYNCALVQGVPDKAPMYFVHSYYAVPEDKSVIAATTDYGVDFCSMIHKDNIYAVQFHPEKSQKSGLKIIENFVRL
jgi:imidazole glycerol-phosphate synthase subunit HisH